MSIFLSLYSRYQKRAFADSLSFLQSKYPFKDTTNKGNKAEKEISDIKESTTFKTGKKVLAAPKKIKKLLGR